jgi:phosphoglycolate phosphatase
MRFTAMICDLDGTLVDSLADLGQSMNAVLAQEGLPVHPLPAYRYFVGNGMEKLAERALPPDWRQPAKVADMARRMRRVYDDSWTNNSAPYDGIPAMLANAAARGLTLGVLSNKIDELTRVIVAHFFPEVPFAAVAGAREQVPKKPHPQAALAMAGRMEVEPCDCIFLGDTAVDMQTAGAAGMYAVGVEWGFREAGELIDAGARLILSHPRELEELLSQ